MRRVKSYKQSRICANCRHFKTIKRGSVVKRICSLNGFKVLPIMKSCPVYAELPPHLRPEVETYVKQYEIVVK